MRKKPNIAIIDTGTSNLRSVKYALEEFNANVYQVSSYKNFPKNINANQLERAFYLLQATRSKIFFPDYIACPSCGRTLFDLQLATQKIKKATSHLKGVKIGIMGCIVNGPGEMADADFGYVGSGRGKIDLYLGQQQIKKGVDEQNAVDDLVDLIKENGRWIDPPLTTEI